MKRGVISIIPLILSISLWPLMPGLAAADLGYSAMVGKITNAHTHTSEFFQLAKQNGESDKDDKEGKHGAHHGRYHEKKGKAYSDQQFCGPYFSPNSVPYFRDYYSRDNYANLPPGLRKHLQKSGHLPPGLEKQYERTGQLPPGLQKRFECGQQFPADYFPYLYPVPAATYARVGPLPPDSRLYLYGNDLLLLNYHSRAIIDMLRGAY